MSQSEGDQHPHHFVRTKALIERAFPSGMTEPEYMALLRLLGPHLSDRNLSEVVAACAGRHPAEVSNDLAKVFWISEGELPALPSVLSRLQAAGLDGWLAEE